MSCEHIITRGPRKGQKCGIKPRTGNKCHKHSEKIKGSEKGECTICLESGNNLISVCSNNHLFHVKCIKKWGKLNDNCPICRENIPDKFLNKRAIEDYRIERENEINEQAILDIEDFDRIIIRINEDVLENYLYEIGILY